MKRIWDICEYPYKGNCNPNWCGTEVCQRYVPKSPLDNKRRLRKPIEPFPEFPIDVFNFVSDEIYLQDLENYKDAVEKWKKKVGE